MMIIKRSAVAAATLALPAAAPSAVPALAVVPQLLPIGVAVGALPLAVDDRTGYQRTSFKHWNAGDVPADGCNTRQEVLLAEAVVYPEIGPGCSLTGGTWWSYYDEREVTPAGVLDIDHMVPLAEAWVLGPPPPVPHRHPPRPRRPGRRRDPPALRPTPQPTFLTLGRTPIPVPTTLADHPAPQGWAANTSAGWLFPGHLPGAHISAAALSRRLAAHHIPNRPARTAALVALACDLPPAVLGPMLGLHPITAVQWRRRAATDWTAYLAARTATTATGSVEERTDLDRLGPGGD